MALDMEQLRKMFYEECRENLEVLEDVLLNLDVTSIDEESINTIFRAAHSIKGGAATFNLFDISEFTHSVEAYLDRVRNNERELTAGTVDLLLKSGDCIRSMLEGHEQGSEVNSELQQEVSAELHQLLGEDVSTPDCQTTQNEASVDEAEEPETDSTQGDWHVIFEPHPEMFFSGNDPLRILRELNELHPSCVITVITESLPDIEAIEAELCYLKWQAQLAAEVEEADIREIFEWVEDECELSIEFVSQPSTVVESKPSESVQQEAAAAKDTHPAVMAKAEQKSAKVAKTESSVSSIRVDIDKVDSLINLVGELVITQSMLTEIGNDFTMEKLEKLKVGLAQLLQNSKDLQENVLNIRMLRMSFALGAILSRCESILYVDVSNCRRALHAMFSLGYRHVGRRPDSKGLHACFSMGSLRSGRWTDVSG